MNIKKNSKLIFFFVVITLILTGCGAQVSIDPGGLAPVTSIHFGKRYEFCDYDIETNGDRKDVIVHFIKKGDTDDREGTGE